MCIYVDLYQTFLLYCPTEYKTCKKVLLVWGKFPLRQHQVIVIMCVSVMSGMWLSRIIVLPYCEKGPWRRRWQRKPEDGTIVIWLLNCPIIQIFDHQIFDKIQLHQINRQLFLPKISKTSWAGCSPLVGNAPSQKILLWVQQIWKRGEAREKNFKTNMDFLECCICLLSKRNVNWPGLAS